MRSGIFLQERCENALQQRVLSERNGAIVLHGLRAGIDIADERSANGLHGVHPRILSERIRENDL